MITFGSLNRANKAKVSIILELIKVQHKDKMKSLIKTIEDF